MFDCVYPTRSARHALALTRTGRLNLRNASFSQDFQPLDRSCRCTVCAAFTRAYLAHLFRAGEMLAPRLVSVHNIFFLNELAKEARGAIVDGTFASWSAQRLASLREPTTVETK
jgi:queuine tRNA-ribosyltransferase